LEWTCSKTNNTLEVYFGPYLKGVYKLLEEPFCHICCHSGVTTEQCTWHHLLYGFNRIYAMGRYFPYVRRAKDDLLSYHIWAFKKWRNYAHPLGNALEVLVQQSYKELLKSQLMVPVPLHPNKVIQRGYNQALELANVLNSYLKIPVADVLIKTRDVDMRPLKWEQRKEAVEGLYTINNTLRDQVRGKNVILIDDVITSGFTASECSKVLLESGAKRVNVLTAGRSVL